MGSGTISRRGEEEKKREPEAEGSHPRAARGLRTEDGTGLAARTCRGELMAFLGFALWWSVAATAVTVSATDRLTSYLLVALLRV